MGRPWLRSSVCSRCGVVRGRVVVVVVVDFEARPAVPSASSEGAAVRVSWLPRPTQREPFQTTRTHRLCRLKASSNYSQCRPDFHFHANREFWPFDLAPPRNNCARCRCAPPPSPQHPTTRLRARHISLQSPVTSRVLIIPDPFQTYAVGCLLRPQQRAAIRPRRVHEPLHTSRSRGQPPPAQSMC